MEKRLQWTLYSGFITVGLVSSIIGPLLTVIRSDIKLSFSQAGIILSAQFIGMLLTVILAGYLADKYGKKTILMIAGAFLFAGSLGSMFSYNYSSLLFFTVVSGIGFGTYDVVINALCADYADSNKGSAMNSLHVFYGLGAISGPVIVTLFIKLFNSWRIVFGFSALFPIAVSILLWPIADNKRKSSNNSKQVFPYTNKFIWISGIFCFIYVGIEVSSYGWLPTYWQYTFPNSFIPAPLLATVFWSTLTLGRIFSGKLADKFGLSNFLICASIGTIISTLVWAVIPIMLIKLIATLLLGLFLSGIFPTNMANATSCFPENSAIIAAFISIFSSLGGAVIPSAIGSSVDYIGISKIPLLVCGLSVLLFISGALLKKCEVEKISYINE